MLGIAHRADDDHRLRRADGEVEEVGELFERVGAAGDDDAREARVVLEQLVEALGEREPLIERELRAGQVRELLELGLRVAADVRHQVDELFGGEPAAVLVGDRAAGGDEPDARELRGLGGLDCGLAEPQNVCAGGPSGQPERQKKSGDDAAGGRASRHYT